MQREAYRAVIQDQYKVFIASPSDVLLERKIAHEAIDGVNRILAIMHKSYRLEVYAWEDRVHPDIGSPQEVILRQIPVHECDIFVGVFWKRFGTPPGGVRPRDGRPYLSGTEQEICEAIESREKGANDRPIIMLYRKMDPLPGDMTDNDYTQHSRVIEFFRQCEPGGEHPALIIKFEGEFRQLLVDHILRVVTRLEEDDQVRSQTSAPVALRFELELGTESDPETRWLKRVRLRENPFQHYLAEDELYLPHYFVSLEELPIQKLIGEPKPWAVFANAGCGKTALRTIMAARCFPKSPKSDILCIVCGFKELERALEQAKASLDKLDSIHHVQTIARLAVSAIRTRPDEPLEQFGEDPILRERWADLQKFACFGKSKLGRPATKLKACRWLEDLVTVTRAAGFRFLMCLVDQVDELPAVQGQPDKMAQLLAPLMRPAVRETRGITFRYFLPRFLEPLMQREHAVFRLDRLQRGYVQWTEQDLQRLIQQRMTYFSRDQFAPYRSLGELCESTRGFAETIDSNIVGLAEGSPRAAIWLADRLIQLHCQADEPPRLIEPETWERVKVEWWLRGRAQAFGVPDEDTGFRLVSDRIYFRDREVVLSKRGHALLECLVQANGKVCSRIELARAAWPDENPEGVSKRAVNEAIRRMKKKLQEQGADPSWIKTERGRGYRMRDPEHEDAND